MFHAGGYAIMAWLAWRAFTHRISIPAIVAVTAFLYTSLYGISDEWHQSFVPHRDPDVWDRVADSTGGLCAILFLYHRSRGSTANQKSVR